VITAVQRTASRAAPGTTTDRGLATMLVTTHTHTHTHTALHGWMLSLSHLSLVSSPNVAYMLVGWRYTHTHTHTHTHSVSLSPPFPPSYSIFSLSLRVLGLLLTAPSLILFIGIDASALCLHPSLYFPFLLRLLPLPSLLIPLFFSFLSPILTFKLMHTFTFSLHTHTHTVVAALPLDYR